VKDWNPKKISLRSYLPEVLKTSPRAGSGMSASFLPSSPNSFSSEVGIVFVLRQQLAAGHARILQHGICLRDEFLPAFALGVGRVGDKDPIVGRVFVGCDVGLPSKNSAP